MIKGLNHLIPLQQLELIIARKIFKFNRIVKLKYKSGIQPDKSSLSLLPWRILSFTTRHYKNSVGALVVYDVSNRSSFDSVGEWINIIRDRADDSVIIGLVANKIDLPVGRRIISTE